MADIQKTINKEDGITTFTVSGEFLYDQIIDVVKQFYLSEFTLHIVFDLTNADMSAITADQMENIVSVAKRYAHLREGGKTAFVMSSELGYGLARMYEAYSQVRDHPIAHHVFRNMEEAMSWMMEKDR